MQKRRLGAKANPGDLIYSYPLRHKSSEPKPKRNVSYYGRTCFSDARRVSAEFRDTINFTIHSDFDACTCARMCVTGVDKRVPAKVMFLIKKLAFAESGTNRANTGKLEPSAEKYSRDDFYDWGHTGPRFSARFPTRFPSIRIRDARANVFH